MAVDTLKLQPFSDVVRDVDGYWEDVNDSILMAFTGSITNISGETKHYIKGEEVTQGQIIKDSLKNIMES